jgi:hypothetical protein
MGPEEGSNKLNWPVPILQSALQSFALPRNLALDIFFAYSMKLCFQLRRSHSVKDYDVQEWLNGWVIGVKM